MADRMGAKIHSSRVDHSSMYTSTDLVVDAIREAALKTCGDGVLADQAANN